MRLPWWPALKGNGQTGMMARERLYFDYNATAPLLTAARSAMVDAMDLPGNPSSVHAEGRKARAVIGSAREAVARLCDVPAAQVSFLLGRDGSRQSCPDAGFPDGPFAGAGVAAVGVGGRASGDAGSAAGFR
jgi:hypothetical protein